MQRNDTFTILRRPSENVRHVIRLVRMVVGAKVRITANNSVKSIAHPNVLRDDVLDRSREIVAIFSVLVDVMDPLKKSA